MKQAIHRITVITNMGNAYGYVCSCEERFPDLAAIRHHISEARPEA